MAWKNCFHQERGFVAVHGPSALLMSLHKDLGWAGESLELRLLLCPCPLPPGALERLETSN